MIRNDAGEVGQAVALMTNGDRILLRRCHIFGNQDTIYTYGRYGEDGQTCRSLYEDCLIEGTTDFIFGPGRCWFENCEIRSKRNSYITAASTFEGEKFGYVFNRCRHRQGISGASLEGLRQSGLSQLRDGAAHPSGGMAQLEQAGQGEDGFLCRIQLQRSWFGRLRTCRLVACSV